MAKLAIMVGLPASGKSTFLKQRIDSSFIRISTDNIRLALYGRQYILQAEPFVWAIAETMARTLLLEGYNVAIDATNTTKRRRAKWVRLAREFNVRLQIYVFKLPLATVKERNRQREAYVPEELIDRLHANWEEPTEEEGIINYFTAT